MRKPSSNRELPFPYRYSAWAAKICYFSTTSNYRNRIWLQNTFKTVVVLIFVFGGHIAEKRGNLLVMERTAVHLRDGLQ